MHGQGPMLAAAVVDPRPVFAPSTYARWKRALGLFTSAQNGATVKQLASKITHAWPAPDQITGLDYMEQTDASPATRTIAAIIDVLGERYGKTDTGKARPWISDVTEFTKTTYGRYKEYFPRFFRCTTRLGALGMKLIGRMIRNKDL